MRGDTRRLALGEVVETYLADLATRARSTSVVRAKRGLERLLGGLSVAWADELTPALLLRWRAERVAGGAANKTANTEVGYLRAALGLAVRLGQLDQHPLAGLRGLPVGARHQHRRPRALSDWEVRKVLAAAEELDRPRTKDGRRGTVPQAPLVRALVGTGARWGELVAATWADLDLERGTLTFREETTKTDRGRTIPVAADLLELLAGLPERVREATGEPVTAASPIFLTPKGRPWSRNHRNCYRYLRRVFEAAGVPHQDEAGRVVHIHALRHTFATRLARAGVPLATAQLLTGHRSPTVLLGVYTHLVAEEARQALESLPRLGVASEEPAGESQSTTRGARSQPGA